MHNRIKEIRDDLNLSQREFGEKLGVSRDVISNIEYGRVAPKSIFLSHLCSMYGVNPEWLETGVGKKFIDKNNARNLEEATSLFNDLSPELQEYALEQIKGLLKLQETTKRQ